VTALDAQLEAALATRETAWRKYLAALSRQPFDYVPRPWETTEARDAHAAYELAAGEVTRLRAQQEGTAR
jgi:hypothetical protein